MLHAAMIRRYRRGQGGQVLAFALILMVVVIVAAFIIFDIQTVIRGKIKGQNAVDAAALTGATWQQHGLNLIGELNLAKASTVLLSDSLFGITQVDGETYFVTHMKEEDEYRVIARKPDGSVMLDEEGNVIKAISLDAYASDIKRVIREREQLIGVLALISQMQTRVSFVLPLIGYGAAQQAAKNNGITYNADANDTMRKLYHEVRTGEFYGDPMIAPQYVNGYAWRVPYANMLEAICNTGSQDSSNHHFGIAVFSKVNWLGAPILRSDPPNAMTSYLSSKSFYEAILANSWCELKEILLGDYNFDGTWWGTFECDYTDTFLEEAEILPLHIDFFTGATPYYNARLDEVFPERYADKNAEAGEFALLGKYYNNKDPYKYWFDEEGKLQMRISPFRNPEDADLNFNILPDFTWCVYDSTWTNYSPQTKQYWKIYLRDSFREGYDYYSGALAWFGMSQKTRTLSGNMMSENGGGDLGKAFSGTDAAGEISRTQADLRSGVSDIEADSLAKPFGRIHVDGKYLPPFYAGNMVLPVFTEVALIPVSLEPVSGIEQDDKGWIIFLTKYIPLLASSSTLDETWEKMIREHPDEAHYCSRYHRALQKISDPAWRQAGIDWLNTPVSYDKEGNPTSYKKDHCNDWPSGGSGNRAGPGSLH